jgi:hypothetical protein
MYLISTNVPPERRAHSEAFGKTENGRDFKRFTQSSRMHPNIPRKILHESRIPNIKASGSGGLQDL